MTSRDGACAPTPGGTLASLGHIMRSVPTLLDHLVYAVPDLDSAVQDLDAALGIRPSPGGRHVGRGTRNALLSLGEGAYLEIIGPDIEGPPPAGPRPFGIDRLEQPLLVTWAAKAPDIDARVAAARAAGYDPGPVRSMSRETPDGVVLSWRLTSGANTVYPSPVPFLIDWGKTPHPSRTATPGAALLEFHGASPDPQGIEAALRALEVSLSISPADRPALIATLRGPEGSITLR